MLLAQAANAAFLLLLAWVYLDFDNADSILNYLSNTFMSSPPVIYLRDNHVTIGVGYTLMAVPFVYGTLRMLWYSARRRQFAVGPAHKPPSKVMAAMKRPIVKHVMARRAFSIIARGLRDGVNSVSIFGPHFTSFVLAIETFEIVLETVQGYQFSKYISNLQINQAFGLMVFINCCSTPITHYIWIMRRNPAGIARGRMGICDRIIPTQYTSPSSSSCAGTT
ncbi:TPA: hypothetical protein N0F65_012785 [Lagenidium giganteum]|uniref:G protein-coupled receptor n=1 Tax=Lagenidium giganteum TaxID=4803 RepID=A0AAV2YAD1_9STRA|nr:TPA: hypothetical protein N0F65_012785 [Lagenidium giganteum]